MNTVFQCELIKKLAAQITIPKYGFYTEKIFKNGTRVGFKAVSLDSRREVVLAHVDFRSLHKVGKYKVNIKDFDSFLSEALKAFLLREKAIVIIDKVGKMELFSGKFRGLILDILGSTETAIITTRTDLAEGWISKIKDKNCHHFELNRGNSEDVFGQIFKLIQP